MNIALAPVNLEEREILANLLEKYNYEFSQCTQVDVNPLGLYGYRYLDYYWTEKNRWAYFITVDSKLAGFALVNDLSEVKDRETDFQMAEFFVMHKYRRRGVGREAFLQIMMLHKGRWQMMRHPKNIASVQFWNKVIDEYTGSEYELVEDCPGTKYEDGSPGGVFFFVSK